MSTQSTKYIIVFKHKLKPGMKVVLSAEQRVAKHFLTNLGKDKSARQL